MVKLYSQPALLSPLHSARRPRPRFQVYLARKISFIWAGSMVCVSVGMVAMPLPRACDNRFQIREPRLPAQLASNFFRAGNQHRRIACAARGFDRWNLMSGNLPRYFDDLAHTETLSVTQVIDERGRILGRLCQRT